VLVVVKRTAERELDEVHQFARDNSVSRFRSFMEGILQTSFSITSDIFEESVLMALKGALGGITSLVDSLAVGDLQARTPDLDLRTTVKGLDETGDDDTRYLRTKSAKLHTAYS